MEKKIKTFEEKENLCHVQCLNKKWELQEYDDRRKRFIKTPHVMIFNCLSDARKGLITYIRNPDLQDIDFRLREIKSLFNEDQQ